MILLDVKRSTLNQYDLLCMVSQRSTFSELSTVKRHMSVIGVLPITYVHLYTFYVGTNSYNFILNMITTDYL